MFLWKVSRDNKYERMNPQSGVDRIRKLKNSEMFVYHETRFLVQNLKFNLPRNEKWNL